MSNKKTEKDKKNQQISEPDTSISEPESSSIPDISITDVNGAVEPILESVANDMHTASPDIEGLGERIDEMAERDSAGVLFNPEIHAVDDGGKPVMTSTGKYRRKRISSKTEVSTEDLTRHKAAQYSTLAFIQLGVAVFGEEWKPVIDDKENEAEMLTGAFDDYYKQKGVIDIPPSLALVIAVGAYSIKRFGQPETKSRLSKTKDWFVKRVQNLRSRITRKKPEPVDQNVDPTQKVE